MNSQEIEKIEITLFLDAIFNRYGYDFRRYAKASLKRRIRNLVDGKNIKSISEMIPRLLYDEAYFEKLVFNFSITTTEMFRDPEFYLFIRKKIIEILKTYPFIKIWHAGCSTGEEVYSFAILLKEEGLYDRATIFATDFNDAALEIAKEGIYSLKDVKTFTTNYQKSGGRSSFSDYYYAQYESIIMDASLKKRITFANHNLVTDNVFGEMHLIVCRNVLIYFDKELQNKVLTLLKNSLINNGFLCLGAKEGIEYTKVADYFKLVDENERIYQRVIL